ncbi:hypothetical protein ACVWWG_004731 [Bradyrhizobium sp. LB7.2]
MGMWNNGRRNGRQALILRSLRSRRLEGWTRVPLLLLGLAGLLWSAAALPPFWRMMPASAAAFRIIADDRFQPGTLAKVLAAIESQPAAAFEQPEFVRAKALVQLRFSEEAIARKSSEEADGKFAIAENSVKSALAVTPGDSFLWLMLYSVETQRIGFDTKNIKYLEQSYISGPLEGWVALRRNRLAVAIFPALREGTQEKVISEFAGLVDSGFFDEAKRILTSVGWTNRDRLVAGLKKLDILPREALAKKLAADGTGIRVPGVELDERPWR